MNPNYEGLRFSTHYQDIYFIGTFDLKYKDNMIAGFWVRIIIGAVIAVLTLYTMWEF